MAPPSSCTYNKPFPNPQTAGAACSVPIGGSNTTLLDTCCNGHINPVQKYGAPGEDECYQFCTTDEVVDVMACLTINLGEFDADNPTWACFNYAGAKSKSGSEYDSGVGRVKVGKMMATVVLLGLVGAVVGT
jgi:hypothetical protein